MEYPLNTFMFMLANSNTFLSNPDTVELTIFLKGFLNLIKAMFPLPSSLCVFQILIKGFGKA